MLGREENRMLQGEARDSCKWKTGWRLSCGGYNQARTQGRNHSKQSDQPVQRPKAEKTVLYGNKNKASSGWLKSVRQRKSQGRR